MVEDLVDAFFRRGAASDDPSLVNGSAEEDGWFFKVTLSDLSELEGLMDEAAYKAHTA